MSDNTYNGWTNWETWLVHLWFSEILETYVQEDGITDPCDLHNCVSEYVESIDDKALSGFLGDIVSGFLGSVNWRELLRHYTPEAEATIEDV